MRYDFFLLCMLTSYNHHMQSPFQLEQDKDNYEFGISEFLGYEYYPEDFVVNEYAFSNSAILTLRLSVKIDKYINKQNHELGYLTCLEKCAEYLLDNNLTHKNFGFLNEFLCTMLSHKNITENEINDICKNVVNLKVIPKSIEQFANSLLFQAEYVNMKRLYFYLKFNNYI